MYHCSQCWREIDSYEYYTYDGLCEYCRRCRTKCEDCSNYNIGDGIDDIRLCKGCKYK